MTDMTGRPDGRFAFAVDEGAITYVDERRLSPELRRKLERRRAAGYANPQAVPAAERRAFAAALLKANQALAAEQAKPRPNATTIINTSRYIRRLEDSENTRLFGSPVPEPDDWPRPVALTIPVAAFFLLVVLGAVFGAGGLVVGAVLAVPACGVAAWLFNYHDVDPLAVTDADRRDILAATASLPIGHNRDNIGSLVATALELRGRVEASVAWSSRYLEAHRVQLDVGAEVDQIVQNALELHSVTTALGRRPDGDSPTALVARDAYDHMQEPLAMVWDSLVKRVDALAGYATHLNLLDAELANADLAQRMTGLDEDVARLLANAVGNEMAAAHLDRLSADTAGLTQAISELVGMLHNDLHTLRALAPRD